MEFVGIVVYPLASNLDFLLVSPYILMLNIMCQPIARDWGIA